MKLSTKRIKLLSELLGNRTFVLPRNLANDIDIKTGRPCLFVAVNGKPCYLPIETETPIPYDIFCVLKDLGILDYYRDYKEGQLL